MNNTFKSPVQWIILLVFILCPLFALMVNTVSADSSVFPIDDICSKLDLENTALSSHIIVSGQVLDRESRWNDKKSIIHSYSNFEVKQWIKGISTEKTTITVRTYGGKVGTIGQIAMGSPVLVPGQEYILFLIKSAKKETFEIYGLTRGTYKLEKGPDISEPTIKITSSHFEGPGKPVNSKSPSISDNTMSTIQNALSSDISFSIFVSKVKQYISLAGGDRHDR